MDMADIAIGLVKFATRHQIPVPSTTQSWSRFLQAPPKASWMPEDLSLEIARLNSDFKDNYLEQLNEVAGQYLQRADARSPKVVEKERVKSILSCFGEKYPGCKSVLIDNKTFEAELGEALGTSSPAALANAIRKLESSKVLSYQKGARLWELKLI